MSVQYLYVIIAFVLGQSLMAAIDVYFYQKKKEIDYFVALKTYFQAEIGYFIIGFIGIITVCFILSEWIDLSLTHSDLQNIEHRTWKETIQLYFRTSAFVISAFIQYIVFRAKARGKAAIDKLIDEA